MKAEIEGSQPFSFHDSLFFKACDALVEVANRLFEGGDCSVCSWLDSALTNDLPHETFLPSTRRAAVGGAVAANACKSP